MISIDKRVFSFVALLAASFLMSACGGGNSSSGSNNNNPPPATGTAISVSFGGAAPIALAEQIGTGNWTAASLQGSTLSFTVPSGTANYAIAYLCPTWQGMGPVNSEYVIEATTADATTYTAYCIPSFTPGTISGNFDASAIPNTANVEIYAIETSQLVSGKTGAFSFQAPKGQNDIAVVALDSSYNILGAKIVRGQTVPGTVPGTITLAASDATATQTMAATNIPAGFPTPVAGPYAEYTTANETIFPISTTSDAYSVIPSSEAQGGDFYSFTANDSNTNNQSVGVTQVSTTAGAVSLSFPAPLTYVAPSTTANFPTFTINYTGFSSDSSVSYVGNMQWAVTNTGPVDGITVTATPNYQNGSATLAIPDLTALSGFLPAPASGTSISWFAYVYGGNSPWFTPLGANSGTLSWGQNSGTYTQP